MSKDTLSNLRTQISDLDAKLLEILAQRKDVALKVVSEKEKGNQNLRDESREQEVLLNAFKKSKELGLDNHYVNSIFKEILADSNRIQRKYLQSKINSESAVDALKISCQQAYVKYNTEAAKKHFTNTSLNYNLCETIKDVFEEVQQGKSDYGIIPIENTIAGANNEVYDLLLNAQNQIVGEIKVQIETCLVALAGESIKSIKEVYCHPRDVMLCRNFLAENGLKIRYLADYENAVDKIRELNKPGIAGLTGKLLEDITGLAVIAEDISNQKEVFFRFIVVARKPVKVDMRVPAKTSIVFSTQQVPGALADALNVFKNYEINLTKLESRPVPGNNWEEMFYLDLQGNVQDERVKLALDEVGKQSKFIRVLGCYPIPDVEAVQVKLPTQVDDRKVEVKVPEKVAVVATTKKSSLISSRDHKQEDTIIEVKGVKIGGKSFTVMSGPCSVESYQQIMDCAELASNTGCQILRGGCFKPRTSPYSFQGLGYEGLDMLVEAGKKYHMPIITEVMSTEDVHKVAEKTDIIQVGARNMQNFTLLAEIGKTQKPVLLKRGMSCTISDMLDAAEYILAQGNLQVMFCERGIRTFETATRFTLDLSAVPLIKRRSHLPIIIDPSHAAGVRDLVPALAIAAKAIGAHGIIVEFHPEPEKALSDGPQALRFHQMEKLMQDLGNTPWGDY